MSVEGLDYAAPFFDVDYLTDEKRYAVKNRSIVFNLSGEPVRIAGHPVGFYQSVVAKDVTIENAKRCLVIIDIFRYTDTELLFEEIKKQWTLAFDATKEERHRGVMLWRSKKVQIGNASVNMCYAGSIPLKVGLHRSHWGGPPIKEVHTQIVGVGVMQQYAEQDLSTLYREEYMAPGASHIPMYNANIEYPWHQYETVTRGIFQATEMRAE